MRGRRLSALDHAGCDERLLAAYRGGGANKPTKRKGRKGEKRLAESIPSGRLALFSFSFLSFFWVGLFLSHSPPASDVRPPAEGLVLTGFSVAKNRNQANSQTNSFSFFRALPDLFLVAFPASSAVLLLCHASLLASMNRCAAQLLQKTPPPGLSFVPEKRETWSIVPIVINNFEYTDRGYLAGYPRAAATPVNLTTITAPPAINHLPVVASMPYSLLL